MEYREHDFRITIQAEASLEPREIAKAISDVLNGTGKGGNRSLSEVVGAGHPEGIYALGYIDTQYPMEGHRLHIHVG